MWKKALTLVKTAYALCAFLPKTEQYGLISQIQRCAVSIPANIAEGRSRHSRKEFCFFLKIASGSLAELETHFFIAIELGYLSEEQCCSLFNDCAEIGRMLNGLLKSLKAPSLTPETRNLEPVS